MKKRNVLTSLFTMVSISLTGCASAPSAESIKQQKSGESLSVSAYKRVLPHLTALEPGDNIGSKIDWHHFKLQEGGKTTRIGVADGWVAPLSGDFLGGLFGNGRISGRSGNLVFGEHVFGYLFSGATLVPQYVVMTQATLVTPEEYTQLVEKGTHNIGWADMPRDSLPRTQFKNITVKEVRHLDIYEDEDFEGVKLEKAGTLADVIRSFTTRERFENAEKRLKSLIPGTDHWEVIKALNGIYMTTDSGIKYLMLTDGHLGGSWGKLIPSGYFHVMSFGYIEDNKEVPKLALIFKNNKVHKLVAHASREELQRYFQE